MDYVQLRMAIMSASSNVLEFAINWMIQSTLLIGIGMLAAGWLAHRGAAFQSLVYRATLAAILLCPGCTMMLSLFGASGWSVELPAGFTFQATSSPQSQRPSLSADMTRSNATTSGSARSDAARSRRDSGRVRSAEGARGGELTRHPRTNASRELDLENSVRGRSQEAGTEVVESGIVAATQAGQFEVSWFGWLAPLTTVGWALVSCWLVCRLHSSWRRMQRLVSDADLADAASRERCEKLAALVGVKTPRVRRSPFISSPCLTGIASPTILLPADHESLSLSDVFVHELAHLRRGDFAWKLLSELACSIFFFQPLIWRLANQIEATSEEVCDDHVVHLGGDREAYASRLVDIAEQATEISRVVVAVAGVGIVSLRSMLSRRVTRIMDSSRPLSTRVGLGIGLTVLVVSFVGTGIVALVGVGEPSHAQQIGADTPDDARRSTAQQTVAGDSATTLPELVVSVFTADGSKATDTYVALTGFQREAMRSVVVASGTTDDRGVCRLVLNAPASVDPEQLLLVRKPGFGIGWKMIDRTTLSDSDDSSLTVKLYEPSTIRGRLIDVDGQPAADEMLKVGFVMDPSAGPETRDRMAGFRDDSAKPSVDADAWYPIVTTDEDGRFELGDVPKGFGVMATLVGSEVFASQDIAINTQLPEQRGPRDGTYRPLVKNVGPGEEAVLTLSPAKVFTGTITYEDTGEPVRSARVSIWASQQEFGSMTSIDTETDDLGRYRLIPKAGIRFGVQVYPPEGVPYMARASERLTWENSDTEREVNLQLPRVPLVRGRVVEAGTGLPVEDAVITFEGSRKAAPENAIIGWQAQRRTDATGAFAYPVSPGQGTLVVRKREANYVLQSVSSRNMTTQKSGGTRCYAHAFHALNVGADDDIIEVTMEVQPGKTLRGTLVDPSGEPLKDVFIMTRTKVWDLSGRWRGDAQPNRSSHFELKGLDPQQSYTVHFLDARRRLGATVEISGDDQDIEVVLQPCGSAKAKFLVDDEERAQQILPTLYFVLTDGPHPYSNDAMRMEKLLADQDFNANVDRVNYAEPPKLDENMEVEFPALIPGATYRLQTQFDGSWGSHDFTVQSGESLDLGEFTPRFRD